MPPDLPPEAVQAAAEAVRTVVGGGMSSSTDVARAALEAAAPLIRADERERIYRCPTPCDGDCEQLCHEVHEIPSRRGHNPEVCEATVIAAAVADERERIAKLAEQHDACYLKQVRTPVDTVPPTVDLEDVQMPFADLIREEAGPG